MLILSRFFRPRVALSICNARWRRLLRWATLLGLWCSMRGKAFICLPSHHPMRHLPSRRLPSDIAGRLCCSQRALAPVIMLGSSRDASVASAAASRPRALQGRHSDVAVASDMGCAGRRPRSQQRVTARQRASRRRGSSSRAQLHGDRGRSRARGRCGGGGDGRASRPPRVAATGRLVDP